MKARQIMSDLIPISGRNNPVYYLTNLKDVCDLLFILFHFWNFRRKEKINKGTNVF